MNPLNQIDYSKFKIEVYTPDGQFIKNVPFNSSYIFYCSGLTPGQEYIILFIYDTILILCTNFTCNDTGKVVYLDPAHFLFNNEISELCYNPNSDMGNKIKTLSKLDKVYQLWEKLITENVDMNNHKHHVIKIPAKRVIKFKAGNELATKVK